jgi:hypothetical protein
VEFARIRRKYKMGYCRVCNIILTPNNCAPSKLIYKSSICCNCERDADRKRYAKYRKEVVSRLGKSCKCCGSNDYNKISIDHIHGCGHKEHESCHGMHFIRKLYYMKVEELLLTYQCLCYNCNYTKGFWGHCPHNFTQNIDLTLISIPNHGVKQTHLSPEDHKKRRLQLRRIYRLQEKLEMIKAYGGKCTKCGEAHPLFLTLDHINNNGYMDEKGAGFYNQLKKLGYPGKDIQLQLLCHNCNAGKEYIDNRANKSEVIKTTAEIYIKQPYSITKEQDEQLLYQARTLYYQINTR